MRAVFICNLILLCSCVGPSPAQLSADSDYMVVVNSVRLPNSMPWYTIFAEHAWVDMKNGDEDSWLRAEVYNSSTGARITAISAEQARATHRWDNRSAVLSVVVGDKASAAIPAIVEFTENYQLEYDAWPGPNSNTFIADLLSSVSGVDARLHHNSVGKDFPWGYFGLGFDWDSGIDVHIMQLTFGVSFWPPAIKLPLLPRIGVHQGWVDG